KDSSGTRANSTFKLWYTAWTLLAVVDAAGAAGVLLRGRPRFVTLNTLRAVAAGTCGVVVLASLVYTVDAWASREYNASGPRTLDGLEFLRTAAPDEYNAQAWLNQNV